MTTKEFLNKFGTNPKNYNQAFINDLMIDFFSLLELNKADNNFKGFNNAVNALKMKFDAINNKLQGDISNKWSYIFATKIAPLREKMCPDYVKLQERKKREYERRQQQKREEYDSIFEDMFDWKRKIFEELISKLESNQVAKEKEILGFSVNEVLTKEIIMTKYRELVKIHHPDAGGKQEDFIRITNAKNVLLTSI